jgi:hypothetical protein
MTNTIWCYCDPGYCSEMHASGMSLLHKRKERAGGHVTRRWQPFLVNIYGTCTSQVARDMLIISSGTRKISDTHCIQRGPIEFLLILLYDVLSSYLQCGSTVNFGFSLTSIFYTVPTYLYRVLLKVVQIF